MTKEKKAFMIAEGNRVRLQRESIGISQEELARRNKE